MVIRSVLCTRVHVRHTVRNGCVWLCVRCSSARVCVCVYTHTRRGDTRCRSVGVRCARECILLKALAEPRYVRGARVHTHTLARITPCVHIHAHTHTLPRMCACDRDAARSANARNEASVRECRRDMCARALRTDLRFECAPRESLSASRGCCVLSSRVALRANLAQSHEHKSASRRPRFLFIIARGYILIRPHAPPP